MRAHLFVELLEARCLLSYTIIELGTLGGIYTSGYGLNNSGVVVGESETGIHNLTHAFLWDSDTGMRDLGSLGNYGSAAHAVNDKGVVVGTGGGEALLWDSARKITDIGPGIAYGINNAGQVVGSSHNRAFIWDEKSGTTDIGPGTAYGINNASQVVGYSYGVGGGHAFLWDSISGMTDLGTLGGRSSSARGINDKGQVVGFSDSSLGGGGTHAFIWQNQTGMIDLLIKGGYCGPLAHYNTFADAINTGGEVVGSVNGPTEPCGYVWDAVNGERELRGSNDPRFYIKRAYGINNLGQITGFGTRDGYYLHAFLLTPDDATATGREAAPVFLHWAPQTAAHGSEPNQPLVIDAVPQPSPDATLSPVPLATRETVDTLPHRAWDCHDGAAEVVWQDAAGLEKMGFIGIDER